MDFEHLYGSNTAVGTDFAFKRDLCRKGGSLILIAFEVVCLVGVLYSDTFTNSCLAEKSDFERSLQTNLLTKSTSIV